MSWSREVEGLVGLSREVEGLVGLCPRVHLGIFRRVLLPLRGRQVSEDTW